MWLLHRKGVKEMDWKMLCGECRRKFLLENDNCELTFYQNNPAMHWIVARCPDCTDYTSAFLTPAQFLALSATMLPLDSEEADAPQAIQDEFEKHQGHIGEGVFPPDPPKPQIPQQRLPEYQLTTRLEDEIRHLAEVLDTAPADAIMDLFSSPPPKSYMPERWIQ